MLGRLAAAGVRCPMPQSVRRNKCGRPREAGVSGWLSFWAASPARCGEAGRAASWNLVAEESSSVRADACRDGWRGSLMDAKTLLVSYRSLARFFGCTPVHRFAWFGKHGCH